MHASFTGSARKPRQVNLSGRPASNPWAALSGTSSKPGHSAANSAVAHAQADRARRQHDREKLTASRKVQKTWRGHSSRRAQKAKWREEWDQNERSRRGLDLQGHAENMNDAILSGAEPPRYEDPQLMVRQLHLLVNFQEYRRQIVRNPTDTARLLYFARALQASSIVIDDPTTRARLVKLGLTAVRHIKSILQSPGNGLNKSTVSDLLKMIAWLATLVPNEMAQQVEGCIGILNEMLSVHAPQDYQDNSLLALSTLLRTATPYDLRPYRAFVAVVLTSRTLSTNIPILEQLADVINYQLLAQACLEPASPPFSPPYSSHQRLWQLGYVIWITRYLHHQLHEEDKFDYIRILSFLLSECANEVADRMGVLAVPMNPTSNSTPIPLEEFLYDALNFISTQEAVAGNIAIISQQVESQQLSRASSTKHLTDYAVAMLRAFASNGEKVRYIRSWFWSTTVQNSEGESISTLEFLWSSVTQSSVFRRISLTSREALSTLREARPQTSQLNDTPATGEEIDLWRVEWRVIMFFMELYTFALTIIDDDEFFAEKPTEGQDAQPVTNVRTRGLPVEDSAKLVIFLKNLAFTLYWNAAELVQATPAENLDTLAGLFSGVRSLPIRPTGQLLTGNGVTHAYLKDTSTSLLRLLHDRDSRRSFVPVNGWLMTSQVDMNGFIGAVVEEEERRHQVAADDDDDDEDDVGMHEHEHHEHEDEHAAELNFEAPRLSGSGGINYSRSSLQHNMIERQRRQALVKRMIESLAPRLEILRNLPFFIPFDTRVAIFRAFVLKDQLRRRNGHVDPDVWRHSQLAATPISMGRDLNGLPLRNDVITRQHAEINRNHVFEDAYEQYFPLGERLKEPIQITFVDRFGEREAGIDGGGVTKEFLISVTNEALDPNSPSPMFVENAEHYLYPNPTIWQEQVETLKRRGVREGSQQWGDHLREFLRRYEFLGRIIGKCLYEGILLDVGFAGFFLLKWALTGGNTVASNESGYRASINDLREYDKGLYDGLLKLKSYPGNVEADYGLNFTVNDNLNVTDENGERHSVVKTFELMPNGANRAVDQVYRHVYIDRLVKYRLQQQPAKITDAFLRGLSTIISPTWLGMFNQKELQKLVGGDPAELDIADLRRNTMYGGLYVIGDDGLEHQTVEMFWKAMQEMDDEDRRKVLKFVTSTPRSPLLGFSNLHPKFTIRDGTSDRARLPSASTCVNMLKLPKYEQLDELKAKLLYAVNSGAGFDLS